MSFKIKSIEFDNSESKATVDNTELLCQNNIANIPITCKSLINVHTKSNFILKSTIKSIESEVKNIHNNLISFLNNFLTRTEATTYTTIDRYNSFIENVLTKSMLEETLAQYAKSDDVNKMKANILQKANSLAAEVSDFAAAAMVGINTTATAVSGTVTQPGGGD